METKPPNIYQRLREVMKAVAYIKKDTTVEGAQQYKAVTHDMVSAYRIADRIAMLHEGKIHVVGTPKEIQATQDPVVRQFITGVGDETQEVQRGTATVH